MALSDPLAQQVLRITKLAGDKIMAIYEKDFAIYEKQDTSPLTEADLAAHHVIVDELKAISELPILSEESADIAWEERQSWQQYWLVDPLDGTKEFINKRTDFTVNIGFIDKSAPVSGIVYAPALNRLFFTLHNKAYETNIAPDDKIIDDIDMLYSTLSKAKAIHVRPKPDDGLVVVASR